MASRSLPSLGFSHHLAVPADRARGGVLLVHSWWGLNAFVVALAERLADRGYVCVAPDLFDGDIAETLAEAMKLRAKRRKIPHYRKLLAGLSLLSAAQGRHPSVIGFSMGGHWAWWLAAQRDVTLDAVVAFYAARAADFSHATARSQGHFADRDPFVSRAARQFLERRLTAAGRPFELHDYPGTRHWFFEEGRPEFDEEAAALAWSRTLQFLDGAQGAIDPGEGGPLGTR